MAKPALPSQIRQLKNARTEVVNLQIEIYLLTGQNSEAVNIAQNFDLFINTSDVHASEAKARAAIDHCRITQKQLSKTVAAAKVTAGGDVELLFDVVELLGLDGTGRSSNPYFPVTSGNVGLALFYERARRNG